MRFPFREIHQFIDTQRNFEYLESHGQFDSTAAGGALAGTYPNPTLVLPTYTGLSYAANYSDYGSGFQAGSYAKDGLGVVRLRGGAKKSVAWVAGQTMATLPAGFRPGASEAFTAVAGDGTAGNFIAEVDVTTAGAITIQSSYPVIGAPGTLLFLTLSGITFQQVN